jgi:hypothetical protein
MFKAMWLTACLWCLAGALNSAHASFPDDAGDHPHGVTGKLQVLSVGQMAPADAALLGARREDLATAAEFHGYDISAGTWIESQIACPYAPRYVILHDVQLSQDGSISLFTALIPREAGHVRIIPVLHHGAQASHIFGSTPGQRSLIDEVISARQLSEPLDKNDEWTTLAYCYGALAGAEPVASSTTAPVQTVPHLALDQNGKVREMSFSMLGPDHFYQDWSIQFDGHGKVKAIGLSARSVHPPQDVPGHHSPQWHTVPGGALVVPKPIPSRQ